VGATGAKSAEGLKTAVWGYIVYTSHS
jgi:hypothetical protein